MVCKKICSFIYMIYIYIHSSVYLYFFLSIICIYMQNNMYIYMYTCMYTYIYTSIYMYIYPYTGQPAKLAMLSISFSGTVIRCNFEPFLYWKKGNGRKKNMLILIWAISKWYPILMGKYLYVICICIFDIFLW